MQKNISLAQRAKGKGQSIFFLCFLCFTLCAESVTSAFSDGIKDAPSATAEQSRGVRHPKPGKIVSINLCTDELIFRLVPPERIAAMSAHSANGDVCSVAADAASVKKIKGGVEDVLACDPDLVIGGTFSNRETLRFFRSSETPVLVLGVPKSFEAIYEDIRQLARTVGESGKGEAIIKEMQGKLAALKKISPGPSFAKREIKIRAVFFQSGNYVPGAGTFENAIMEAAGLVNVAAELGIKDYGNLSVEQLLEAKPDVLIFATDQQNGRTVRGEVLDHPAIKKGLPNIKIVKLPSRLLNCGSPASVEAVRILVKEVYSPSLEKRD